MVFNHTVRLFDKMTQDVRRDAAFPRQAMRLPGSTSISVKVRAGSAHPTISRCSGAGIVSSQRGNGPASGIATGLQYARATVESPGVGNERKAAGIVPG